MMTLADKLQMARASLNIKQRQAAEQAGIKQVTISCLERGEKKFIPTEYLQFLQRHGIDLNWLFNDEDENVKFINDYISDTKAGVPSVSLSSGKNTNTGNFRVIYSVKQSHNYQAEIELLSEQLKKLNMQLVLSKQ